MRKDAMWGVLGVLAVMGMAGCGGEKNAAIGDTSSTTPQNAVLPPVAAAQVTITARCRGNSRIEVDVDNWVVHLSSGGALSFVVLDSSGTPNSGLDVDINVPRRANAPWPFAQGFPVKVPPGPGNGRSFGNANRSTGNRPARYTIDASCGNGSNRRTVSIDPDIFVD